MIRLMSFNTQHCRNFITKEIDYDAFADEIRRYDPDIVGLNEIRDEGAREDYHPQTRILSEKLGYAYCYFAKATDFGGNPYGNAILSKYPICSAQTIPIPDPQERACPNGYYETRCVLKAKIDVEDGLTVCVSHFGLNPDEQENAVRTVLQSLEEEKCILMGDFNVTPKDPILQPVRDKMTDTAEVLKKALFSFPSDKPEIKIDYIFTSHDIKTLWADIPGDVVSDHRPYIAEIICRAKDGIRGELAR